MCALGPRRVSELALLALALAVASCREANTYVPPPPPQVTVAPPAREDIVVYLEFAGRTAPCEAVELRARVSGFLEKIAFEEGARVDAGALLYELERAPYEAALESARAESARAQAGVVQTQFELEKVKGLQARGISSDQELVIAQANYDSAVATKAAADSLVRQAELNLAYTRITAPIAGRINESRVDPGNLVGHGEPTLLSTIVRWDPIHVKFAVGERDVLRLRREAAERGGAARADPAIYLRLVDGTDYPLAGRIDYVDNRVDPDTGTIGVRAVFDNPDELLVPGIFARVRIPLPPRAALLVPEVALQRDLAGYFLLLVNAEGVVERRNVTVAELIGAARVITAGLEDDAFVIINGLQRARPGLKVTPQKTTFRPPSGGPTSAPASAPAATLAGTGAAGGQ